jgi:hypothetical protein
MFMETLNLKEFEVLNESFTEYVLERCMNRIRVGSLNVLDCLSFEECGVDGFKLCLEGREYEGSLVENVEEFLVSKSGFKNIGDVCRNVAHNFEVQKVFDLKSYLYRPTVSTVPFTEDGEILLLRKEGSDHWHMPQGGVEKGEDVLEALFRELHEELGVFENGSDGGGCVVPTDFVLKKKISLDRSWKEDTIDGESVLWEGKQLHFYAVDVTGLCVNDMVLSSQDFLVDVGFFGLGSREFATVSEYKKAVVQKTWSEFRW